MDIYKKIIQQWQRRIKEVSPFKREVEFDTEYLSLNKIISFIWPRRAGKTYLMFYIIKNLIKNKLIKKEQIVFIDFTWFLYEEFDIDKLLESFYELYPDIEPCFVFF